jgi:hypothetical protein
MDGILFSFVKTKVLDNIQARLRVMGDLIGDDFLSL